MPSVLSAARYGKTLVRVLRVVREEKWHNIVEYNVEVLLEGDIAASYTDADNSVVVATDSIKNITYYLAKISPHVLNAERFALHLGTFFVSKINVTGHKSPEGHAHSFYRNGEDKRIVKVEIDSVAGKDKLVAKVTSGVKDLLVLKSTGSAFEKFYRDEFTTLVEVNDRIFSTSVDLNYTFAPITIRAPTDEKKLDFVVPLQKGEEGYAGSVWDTDVPGRALTATLDVFATDESASVQATLFKMAERIIAENALVEHVSYALPNKHNIPVDMKYINVDNITPSKAEVFTPVAAPRQVLYSRSFSTTSLISNYKSGLITATISRK